MPEKNLRSKLLNSFENIIKKGALPPSVLFSGPLNSEKVEFATQLMMALNCIENPDKSISPCNSCRNCRRIRQQLFPDFHIVEPEGKKIKVQKIRELKSDLALKPYEARKRIVLIKDCDLLGNQSGNALLKIIEEPPLNTHFILTAKNYMDVLPTIRSRCHNFRFLPKSSGETSGKNLNFLIDDLYPEFEALSQEFRSRIFNIINLFLKNNGNSGLNIFISEYIFAKKGDADSFIMILLIFFRDIIIYKRDRNHIYLSPVEDLIQSTSKVTGDERLFEIMDILFTASDRLRGNVNSKILIESSLLKIQAVLNGI